MVATRSGTSSRIGSRKFDNGVVQYIYDGAGNRVARTESGATIRYLIDDLNPTGYAQVRFWKKLVVGRWSGNTRTG